MADSNVLNWFKQPALIDNDNVFNVGGTTAFTKDAIISVEGDPALGESDYEARWAEFVRAALGGGARVATTALLNYTVTKNDGLIRAVTSDNVVNANLPPSADFYDTVNEVGYTLTLKNIGGANDTNYVGNGSEKIENISPFPITGAGNAITIISIGAGLGWELT
jgi:hypothetical protein